jgi:SAM-dependent methyltransferase
LRESAEAEKSAEKGAEKGGKPYVMASTAKQESQPAERWSDGARAKEYDSEGNRAFYQSALAELLEGTPALTGRGLDLGCGTGFSTEVLVARYPDVTWTGVDASAAMLALARSKPGLAGGELRQASAESLPFADASFDVVVANFSWHWFAEGAGHEVRRVLRPAGRLLATVPLLSFSSAAGNRALARALLAGRRRFARKASQGLRFEATERLLPGPVRVVRKEMRVGREVFADGNELLATLHSRGALDAIFGDRAPAAIEAQSVLDFTWPFALVHLQVNG